MTATSEPPDHEIIREDDGVTVRTARKKETKSANQTPSATLLDEASYVALPPSTTVSSPNKPQSQATPLLTAPREEILPVVIHYNFSISSHPYQPCSFKSYSIRMKAP